MDTIRIDDDYTYQYDDGRVQILRHGRPWLGQETGSFPGSKALIAAAGEIERLREQVARLQTDLLEIKHGVTSTEATEKAR